MQNHTILVVDDEPSMLRFLQTVLEADSYNVETATSGTEALDRVQQKTRLDLVLLDLMMPDLDGLATLKRMRQVKPNLKVIMLTCLSDPRKAVQAMRYGAQDYLTKPFAKDELDLAIQNCLQTQAPPDTVYADQQDVTPVNDNMSFVAASESMKKLRSEIERVAPADVPVLLLGESGTGKEVAARLIHKLSARSERPFLKINCAAMPSELLESELFGYEAGAFTGATKPKPGKFELCDHGTLLLDEIGEMPVSLQAKLLHVLQDNEFSRLGGRRNIRVDVRVLASTNVVVQDAIANRTFRKDLYYRLNAFTITLPPLRERKKEIPLLLRHFMNMLAERYARPLLPLSPAIIETCGGYDWPGNLRELENFVKRYLILADEQRMIGELVERQETQKRFPAPVGARPASQTGDLKKMVRNLKQEAEIEMISRALEEVRWNRRRAAESLNISYKALLYKIRQFGIKPRTP